MKKKRMSFVLSVVACIVLGACSTVNTESLMMDVDEAIEKNEVLENATYLWSFSIQPEGIDQTAEGVFISLGNDEYNWTHKENLGQGQNFVQTAEIDGRQYELVSVDDPGFVPEWKKPEGKILSALELVHPLFENTIKEEYIEEIEITGENGKQYKITLDSKYLEESTIESIGDLKELKDELEEAGDQSGEAQALEENIANLEAIEYSNPAIELGIDAEGYLTKYISQFTFTSPEERSITTTISYELTNYNLEDAESLLPEIY